MKIKNTNLSEESDIILTSYRYLLTLPWDDDELEDLLNLLGVYLVGKGLIVDYRIEE